MPAAPLRRTRLLLWTTHSSAARSSPLWTRSVDAPQRCHARAAPSLSVPRHGLRPPTGRSGARTAAPSIGWGEQGAYSTKRRTMCRPLGRNRRQSPRPCKSRSRKRMRPSFAASSSCRSFVVLFVTSDGWALGWVAVHSGSDYTHTEACSSRTTASDSGNLRSLQVVRYPAGPSTQVQASTCSYSY